MRKFIFISALSGFLLCLALSGFAQKTPSPRSTNLQRCATTEYLDLLIKRDPGLKARMEANQEKLNRLMVEKIQTRINNKNANLRTEAVVTIPVVVHIVLSNPSIVTDADVIWQINKLNEDYAGLNADSANAGPFASLFGHTHIQFCLAQQDEKGNPTNGIERISSPVTWTRNDPEVVKSAATCGADSWDPTRYFNVWVGDATDGTLGIATFPGASDPEFQGVVIHYQGFGNNPAYVASAFNLGRTLVHETGHYFYARHIWGDANCGDDFPSVSGLPVFVDDTPQQSNSTSGCPSGNIASGCAASPNPPGRMYQNYMDYTNDACYCMFTTNQALRMEAALDIFRASLKTSTACSPPVVFANDASIFTVVSPNEGNACTGNGNNTFCSSTFTPRITIKNYGSSSLTSLTINAVVDNLPSVVTNWSGNLAPSATLSIDLNNLTSTTGTHTLKIFTVGPNGAADGRPTNDTVNTSFNIISSAPVTGPILEGFESITFPPNGWRIINPNSGSTTWERTTDAARSGVASVRMPFFDYAERFQQDYLLAPSLDITDADSVILSFDRAYQIFDTDEDFADSLAVVVSTDCGNTFTTAWIKGGAQLASITGTITTKYVPGAADWANARINLKPFTGTANSVIIGFRTVNKFGQDLYLDNVNITIHKLAQRDAAISSVIEPFYRQCTHSFKPSVQLLNRGKDTLKTAKIVFLLNNTPADSVAWAGTLKPGETTIVEGNKNLTLNNLFFQNFTVYVTDPNGLPDQNTSTDTMRVALIVNDPQPAPVKEGFELNDFSLDGWSITPSGSAYTWERTTRAASEKTASAWIRNYRFNSNSKRDDLYSPLVQIGTVDSVYIRFDVAHIDGAGGIPNDTLEVALTDDCGKTLKNVYKKFGPALTTVSPAPTIPPGDTVGFVPNSAAQWRSEFIDVTQFVPGNSRFQVVFRNTSAQGNNTFLDNINIYTVTLPARLKDQGYLISPNPSGGIFTVRHYLVPVTLKGIVVISTSGQVVYRQVFDRNANTTQTVDISRYSSGIYYVRLVYTDKVITEKILKAR